MYFRFLSVLLLGVFLLSCVETEHSAVAAKQFIHMPAQQKIPSSTTVLRVCADPNNMPFSNKREEGFENKIADLIAGEMNVPDEYTCWSQLRGFFRSTLRSGLCDVVIGVPASFELAATTRPYYRSTYVFVSRVDRELDVRSFDDPVLRELKVGVQLVGDDGANTPPVHALNNRGMVANLKGFTLYGNYVEPDPPARIIDAVARGDVDIGVVWGPLAGYFANKKAIPLKIVEVSPQIDLPYLPFVYDISVGVRRGEDDLKNRIDDILQRKHDDIGAILDTYHVPRVRAQGVGQ